VPSNKAFAASFIYPNHAGSYLNLMGALAVGLAWWHSQRARKRLENPGLAVVFIFFALSTATMVIFTYSRMSIGLLVTFALFLSGSFVLRLFQRKRTARGRPEILYLSVALAALLCVGLVTWQTGKVWKRFAGIVANPESALLDRTVPRQAAEKMFRDHWFFGWGAGCFQYGFTKYMKEYSEKEYRAGGLHLFWEHAHDDLLEFPVELGVVGMIPLVGILGCAGWQLYRRRFWRNVVSLLLVLGCTLVVLHASVDFVFQNPAILLTWSVLLVGALRWVELDQPRGRQVDPKS
jgi:O-antigen ligase